MLDTNLKSNRKIRTIITIVILSLFAAGVVESYYMVPKKNIASTVTVEEDIEECIERMDYSLATGNRILYNEVTGTMDASGQMELKTYSKRQADDTEYSGKASKWLPVQFVFQNQIDSTE